MADLDVLKDIPGYRAILKSVLKSQIQLLLEQLAENTAEESIILTASVNDGTLSHLGSSTGKGFLEGRDEIKSQFLGYCLKTHHKQASQEPKSPYQPIQPKPQQLPQPHPVGSIKRSRFSTPPSAQRGNPYTRPILPKPSHRRTSNDNIDTSFQTDTVNRSVQDQSSSDHPVVIKQEGGASHNVGEIDCSALSADAGGSGGAEVSTSFSTTPVSFPSSLSLSHTQTSVDPSTHGGQNDNDTSDSRTEGSEAAPNLDSSVKIEPITENEMELEITGVEMGDGSMGQEQWGQLGYSSEGDNSFTNQSGDHLQFMMNRLQGVVSQAPGQGPGPGPQRSLDSMGPQCTYCYKVFRSNAELGRHFLIHTGEKPFACHLCSRRFNRKYRLQTHLFSRHGLTRGYNDTDTKSLINDPVNTDM